MANQLSTPRVRVTMVDGTEWEAQTRTPDLIRYERTAIKHGWPTKASDSPVQWGCFIAWRAGLRDGHLAPDVTWERFSEELVLDVGTAAGPAVDPTRPGPAPGS